MSRTLAQKLLLKPGRSLWTDTPATRALVGPLPDAVTTAAGLSSCDVGVLTVDSRDAVTRMLDVHGDDLAAPAALWVLYPKGGRADINRDSLWPLLAARGVRPITQVAVDETWSALRFRPMTDAEAADFASRG